MGNNQIEVVRQILYNIAQLKSKQRQDALVQLEILTALRSEKLQQIVSEESVKVPITVDMSNTIWGRDLLTQGRIEGEAKGEVKGKIEGEAAILQRLLEKRFGKLPKWAVARIQKANSEQLEEWSLRVLEAGKLKEVFGD